MYERAVCSVYSYVLLVLSLHLLSLSYSQFLCDKDGVPVKRFGPPEDPLVINSYTVQLSVTCKARCKCQVS